MANVTISDLNPIGSDLFFDTENYLTDLNDRELEKYNVIGGITVTIALTVGFTVGFSVGYTVARRR